MAKTKLEETAVEMQEEVQSDSVTLTKQELDALINKSVRAEQQKIAMAEAKAKAQAALEEETLAARKVNLGIINTKKELESQAKYRVIIRPADGEENVTSGNISINGVDYKFKYNEPVVLPEAALSILRNSVTFSNPEVVYEKDKSGNVVGTHTKPKKIQKRMFNSERL